MCVFASVCVCVCLCLCVYVFIYVGGNLLRRGCKRVYLFHKQCDNDNMMLLYVFTGLYRLFGAPV